MMAMKIGQDLFDYINTVKNTSAKQTMKKRVQEYLPKPEIVDKFESLDERYYLIIFAAEWNVECRVHIPSLAKLLITTNNSNISAKVVDFDENRDIAEEMKVLKIPTIIVHNKAWRELGRFVEKAQSVATLEEELWQMIERGKLGGNQQGAPAAS